MNDIYDLLEEDDLTTDLQLLSDVCGIEIVKQIIKDLNGLNFYIPKITHLEPLVLRYAKLHRDKPLKVIAKELGISEPHLKNLLKK